MDLICHIVTLKDDNAHVMHDNLQITLTKKNYMGHICQNYM